MSPERLGQVEELYHLAREQPLEMRAALLAKVDLELRHEVESLLAHDGGEGLLDRPALGVAAKLLEDSSMELLAVGAPLGPYRIEASIGAGGMGQVYKARDTRLGRAVAIKVSSQQFNSRFEREARAISSLNHPHICTLFDVGPDYLVMELVEGPTLAERLKQSALPMESVLRYGAQIADALAAAHAQGIIHRDLKPGNIMIAKSGVKVMDFGLAKSPQDDTITSSQVVLGSPVYMAPEQRDGKHCDARTDIYALGLVLHEMATGKRPQQDQPASLQNLPEGLTHVIQRCLDMDPEQRWQSARDIRAELDWLGKPKAPAPIPPLVRDAGRKWIWIAAAVIVGLIVWFFTFAYFTRKAPDRAVTRFSFAPPFKADAVDVAVSPDGKHIAFESAGPLASAPWLRSVDSYDAEQLGTELAFRPFWSPDGRSLGFLTTKGLQRLETSNRSGPSQTIAPIAPYDLAGFAWGPQGILYSPEATGVGLDLISANGGTPIVVTSLNATRRDIAHRFPQFLPNGRHFIYWVWSTVEANTGIYLGSLNAKEKLPEGPLVRTWREAQYVEPGYLLFIQGTRLMAQQFDAAKLQLNGEPVPLPELVGVDRALTGRASFSVSPGALAYQEVVPPTGSRFVWRDRKGKQLRSIEAPQWSFSNTFSLSPDEKHVVVHGEDENTLEDLWVVDLERATSLRLTAIHSSNMNPIWSPDGRSLAFRSNRSGSYDIYARQVNGSEDELLVKSSHNKIPTSWSPDGKFLAYDEFNPNTQSDDIWVLPLEGDRKPFPFLKTEFGEGWSVFSPVPDSQGHFWVAYQSNETGQFEVYLRPFLPGTPTGPAGSKVRVSNGGGQVPLLRRDGRELFYAADNGKLMAVDVHLGDTPEIGTPHLLFVREFWGRGTRFQAFADGQRFLFLEPAGEPPTPKINVVLNWTAELKR